MTNTGAADSFADATAMIELRAAPTVVLGVVVEVPQPWGEDLQQWRMGFGDNTADHMPTHITLSAPAKVASAHLDSVLDRITGVCASTSTFTVDTAGMATFRPVSPVVYLSIGDGAAELTGLHTLLRPLVTDEPTLHPYVPHITMAFHLPDAVLDAAAAALADYELSWQVASVSSFLRKRDGRWLRVAQHPLATLG